MDLVRLFQAAPLLGLLRTAVLGQALGSLLPLLAYLNPPEPLMKLLESGSHWFR